MSKLTFLKQNSLDRLQANINSNLHRYTENSPWLTSYFAGSAWLQESNLAEAPNFQLQLPISKTELCDLENTRTVYTALRHLTPLQASDPRLWAYMTHVTHWEYMRKRWPVEQYHGKQNLRDNIQERYFFMPNKSRDFGIIKRSSSAVCFGPPRNKDGYSDAGAARGGGTRWTGEQRWSYSNRFGESTSLGLGQSPG